MCVCIYIYIYIYIYTRGPLSSRMKSMGFINSKEWSGDSHYKYLPLFIHYYMAMVDWWYSFFYQLFTEDVHWPLNVHLFTLPLIHLVVVGFPIFIERVLSFGYHMHGSDNKVQCKVFMSCLSV